MTQLENAVIISIGHAPPDVFDCYISGNRSRFFSRDASRSANHLARNGHRFDQAITHAPVLSTAYASLLSGQIPSRHGLRALNGSTLSASTPWLPELLTEAGFDCAAFVTPQAWHPDSRLSQGFQVCLNEPLSIRESTNRLLGWLAGVANTKRFFAFTHLQQTAYSRIDRQIGRIMRDLRYQNLTEKTLIVITAASTADDNPNVANPELADSKLQVPLIIYPTLGDRSVVPEQVRQVDIFPTVLAALGLHSNPNVDGNSLIDILTRQPQQTANNTQRQVYVEAPNGKGMVTALRQPPWKLVWHQPSDRYTLYNVDVDPFEQNDLAQQHPNTLSNLQRDLQQLSL